MTDVLDLYDHEIKQIVELLAELNQQAKAKQHNYNDFERMIRDRFAKLGFTVDVNWYAYALGGREQKGSAMPEITITGRTDEKFVFDPDRQVHEVVNNLLDLPGQAKGEWIKTDPAAMKRLLGEQGGSGHGH